MAADASSSSSSSWRSLGLAFFPHDRVRRALAAGALHRPLLLGVLAIVGDLLVSFVHRHAATPLIDSRGNGFGSRLWCASDRCQQRSAVDTTHTLPWLHTHRRILEKHGT